MASRKSLEWTNVAESQMADVLAFYRERNGSARYGNKLYASIDSKLRYIAKGIWEGERVAGDSTHRLIFVDAILVFYKEQGGTVIVTKVVDARRDSDEWIL